MTEGLLIFYLIKINSVKHTFPLLSETTACTHIRRGIIHLFYYMEQL